VQGQHANKYPPSRKQSQQQQHHDDELEDEFGRQRQTDPQEYQDQSNFHDEASQDLESEQATETDTVAPTAAVVPIAATSSTVNAPIAGAASTTENYVQPEVHHDTSNSRLPNINGDQAQHFPATALASNISGGTACTFGGTSGATAAAAAAAAAKELYASQDAFWRDR
jgi:hypothetical protein